MTIFSQIEQHKNIAIDMDKTLIDGCGSKNLRSWVQDNHINHNLWIVTFRDTYFAKQVWYELSPFGLKEEYFSGIRNMPQSLHKRYNVAVESFRHIHRRKKYERYLVYHKLTENDVCDILHEVSNWKGMTANELGCTLLIDDMEHMVVPGCQKHGIEWLHPDNLA